MATDLSVPPEAVAAAQKFIQAELGIHEQDPLIGLPQIAQLAGVAANTPMIWRQRSRGDYTGPGKLKKPFPQPDDDRYSDKPQWRAISTVLDWLWETKRWPRGSVARESTRGTRTAA